MIRVAWSRKQSRITISQGQVKKKCSQMGTKTVWTIIGNQKRTLIKKQLVKGTWQVLVQTAVCHLTPPAQMTSLWQRHFLPAKNQVSFHRFYWQELCFDWIILCVSVLPLSSRKKKYSQFYCIIIMCNLCEEYWYWNNYRHQQYLHSYRHHVIIIIFVIIWVFCTWVQVTKSLESNREAIDLWKISLEKKREKSFAFQNGHDHRSLPNR